MEKKRVDLYRMSFGMYGFGGIGRKRSKKCDREYLSKRKGVCGERSDESNADCDKQCASKRWG